MSDETKDNIVDLEKERVKQEEKCIFRKHSSANKAVTIIQTQLIQNTKISPMARFIICYLISLPDDWVVNYVHLGAELRCKKDKVSSLMDELIQLGYVKRTPRRLSSGRVHGYITEYSDSPVFLELEPGAEKTGPGEFSEALPGPVLAGAGGHRLPVLGSLQTITTTLPCLKQDLLKNNNKQTREEWGGIVVVCELKKLLDAKEKDCVNLKQLKIWLQAFGEARVRECITYTIKNAQRSPGGFLRRILEKGWNVNSLESEKPIKNEEQQDMIKWTKEETGRFWNGLTDETKKLKYAGYLHRFPYLEHHMQGKDILDKDIINHPVFDHIMELEGMDHRDRVWK